MQTPPRKGKVITFLRNTHNDQILKLQTKHQQDSDFLEDIRSFTKMRATIEKEYAQALLKLAITYLQKKGPTVPEVKNSSGESYKTVYSVWRTMLDETEKIAKARLAATEVYQQQVSEGAKAVRLYKLHVAKKCFDNLRKMQDEIQQCVVEIDKSKKLYFEEEHMAHDAREKAHDADERLRRKKGRIFQSVSSLQKNSAKFSFRREACDIQATKARNDYVLALVAANAHQMKYYEVDLPELIQYIDCDIYDKVKEYILLISRTELLTCAACQASFNKVQEEANMATKQYTAECYFHDNPVLSQPIIYEFEPCDGDKINKLSIEHNAALCLSKEARRWATCLAKETRVIRDSFEELKKLLTQTGDKSPFTIYEQGPQAEIEMRIDELRQTIRRAQTSKRKAESRLEAMREAGVNVDEWVRTSETDSTTSEASGDALSRSGTVTSRASRQSYQSETFDEEEAEASETFYDSDTAETVSVVPAEIVSETPYVPDISSAVDVVAAVTSAWEAAAEVEPEPAIEEEEQEAKVVNAEPQVNGEAAVIPSTRCVALFSYQATNTDELSFVEQEELELVTEGDGDGWVKARNYRGEEGYIPQNYVEVLENQSTETPARPPLTSFSSVDYTMPDEDQPVVQQNGDVTNAEVSGEVSDNVEQAVVNERPQELQVPAAPSGYCQAVYDYEATCDEELTFFEGQVIRILRKTVHDVDDGWWEGEIDGKVGLFPSLVVEELKDNGEPVTPVTPGETPTESAPPPAFTPPNPEALILPTQVILTQPTPEIENPSDSLTQKIIENGSYAPLVSSPESPTKSMAASLEEKSAEEVSEYKITETPASPETEPGCPTVVITEAQPNSPSPSSCEEEFSYAKSKTPEEKQEKEESGTENTYRSADEFECTFPEVSELQENNELASNSEEQISQNIVQDKVEKKITDQDTEQNAVMMDLNNDSENVSKNDNSVKIPQDCAETTG